MNEGEYFKFDKMTEAAISPEDELSGELALENARLEANLEGLEKDIDELGGKENLAEALKKKPHILASLLGRAALIMPLLITINTIVSGSFAESIQTHDYPEIANFLASQGAASALISSLVEVFKMCTEKQAE